MPIPAELDAIIDRPEGGDVAPAVDPEPAAPAVDPTPAPEPAVDSDPYETGADSFDRKYVEKLRKENQTYRQRARGYDEVYDGYTDEDRDVLLGIARELRDPNTSAGAAQRMANIAQAILSQNQQQPTPQTEQPLTRQEVQAMLAQQSERQQTDAAVRDVYKEAEALGYPEDSRGLIELLYVAANETDNDLKAADRIIKAERQKTIDDYLALKAKESDNTPSMTSPAGTAPSGEKPIKNLKDAKAGLLASGLLDRN